VHRSKEDLNSFCGECKRFQVFFVNLGCVYEQSRKIAKHKVDLIYLYIYIYIYIFGSLEAKKVYHLF
jgi:hypothetical protein